MGKFDWILMNALEKNKGWTPQGSLAVVILSISDACNRKCPHCPRGNGNTHQNDLPMFMTLATVELLCRQLGNCYQGCISISGLGEPLLHPEFKTVVRLINKLCPLATLFLITNGDFLNEEIIAMPELAKVNISTYSEGEYLQFYNAYSNNKVALLKQYGKYQRFNNRAGNVYNHEQLEGGCHMPFFQVTVDTDGRVYQCSCDWKRETPLGDIYKQSIYDIFIKGFRELRLKLNYGKRHETKLCKRCTSSLDSDNALMSFFVGCWIDFYKEN